MKEQDVNLRGNHALALKSKNKHENLKQMKIKQFCSQDGMG